MHGYNYKSIRLYDLIKFIVSYLFQLARKLKRYENCREGETTLILNPS